MKKRIFATLFFLILTPWLCADAFLIEGKLAYFLPNSSTLREIYGSSWLNSQVEITHPLTCWPIPLSAFWSINYLSNCGESIDDQDGTKIRILPISGGLKFRHNLRDDEKLRIDFYAGAGARYYFIHVKNSSDFVKRTVNKDGLGWVAQGGLLFFLNCRVCIDLFADYSSKTFDFSSTAPLVTGHKVNVGGFSAGGGIGFQF